MIVSGVLLDNHYSHLAGTIERIWNELKVGEVLEVLGIRIRTLSDCGLQADSDDFSIWQFCQDNHLLLFSDNRSARHGDSLHAAIQENLTAESLPVLTPSVRNRLAADHDYLFAVMRSIPGVIADILWDDNFLGIGRLYLPIARYQTMP